MLRKQKRHREGTAEPIRRPAAIVAVVSLVGAFALAGPSAASGGAGYSTYASGQFLSGSMAGMDLAGIVELEPAEARNDGSVPTSEKVDPLAVGVLGGEPVDASGVGDAVPDEALGASIDGGAIGQYARAESTGAALGASGTISDGGAIGPDASPGYNPLSISFDTLLDQEVADVVVGLRLELAAIAAQASGAPDAVSGDYYIDGLTLRFTSPALAGVATAVGEAIDQVELRVDALAGPDGALAPAVRDSLLGIDPALGALGTGANVSIALAVDLDAAIADLLGASYGGDGVSFDLSTGEVAIDLEALAGGDLNNRPVGYQVLQAATVNSIVGTIMGNVETLADQLLERVELALHHARLDIEADVSVLTPQAPISGEVCRLVRVPDAPDGLVGGILNGLGLGHGAAASGLADQPVCSDRIRALPSLETAASVDFHGTLGQLLTGEAPLTVRALVLGVPVNVSTGALLDRLIAGTNDWLFDTDGALDLLDGLLQSNVVSPVHEGMLGTTGVRTVLNELLSIRINLQETRVGGGALAVPGDTLFTQTAMRVGVASDVADGGLTTLNLAAASVAPSVTPGAPGGPGAPGAPGDPGGPGSDADSGVAADGTGGLLDGRFGPLAATGVSIGALLLLLGALVTAGVWLVRRGRGQSGAPMA
ncbi:choice-of-anchor G family protein [Cryobacterium sp. BB736]|uniref:choice-of-anchor G family protein n=1 Tax=Cryobacterium sp. BB736 TaxID=2746963 RepID=UPI00351C8BBE